MSRTKTARKPARTEKPRPSPQPPDRGGGFGLPVKPGMKVYARNDGNWQDAIVLQALQDGVLVRGDEDGKTYGAKWEDVLVYPEVPDDAGPAGVAGSPAEPTMSEAAREAARRFGSEDSSAPEEPTHEAAVVNADQGSGSAEEQSIRSAAHRLIDETPITTVAASLPVLRKYTPQASRRAEIDPDKEGDALRRLVIAMPAAARDELGIDDASDFLSKCIDEVTNMIAEGGWQAMADVLEFIQAWPSVDALGLRRPVDGYARKPLAEIVDKLSVYTRDELEAVQRMLDAYYRADDGHATARRRIDALIAGWDSRQQSRGDDAECESASIPAPGDDLIGVIAKQLGRLSPSQLKGVSRALRELGSESEWLIEPGACAHVR